MSKTSEPEIEILENESQKSWRRRKSKSGKNRVVVYKKSGGGQAIYFLGFIGSLVYWLKATTGIGGFFVAIFKSLVWPAYVVFELLENFFGAV